MLYGYARVSTDKQEHSAGAQHDRLLAHAKALGVVMSNVYVDEDVTGSIPLKRRPKGQQLWDTLRAGDEVVFVKLDRGFRNMSDAAHTLQVWAQLGVKMRILDLPLDLSTPEGRLMFHQFAAFSQFEKERIGQRTREIFAHLKRTGKAYACCRPFGWLRKGREWVACESERLTGGKVLAMRAQGMAFPKIALALCHDGVRKPTKKKGRSDYYHVPDVVSLHRAAKAGYPRLPQAFWRVRGYAQTLAAMKSDGHPL